jgi:Fe-S cluster assembly iron-binding protein IscA
VFGLVQGEPQDEDIVVALDGFSFAVEDYYEGLITSYEIDYISSVFRKGFVIYPNGQRRSC